MGNSMVSVFAIRNKLTGAYVTNVHHCTERTNPRSVAVYAQERYAKTALVMYAKHKVSRMSGNSYHTLYRDDPRVCSAIEEYEIVEAVFA